MIYANASPNAPSVTIGPQRGRSIEAAIPVFVLLALVSDAVESAVLDVLVALPVTTFSVDLAVTVRLISP